MISDRQKIFFSILLLIILATVTIDLFQDWGSGTTTMHFITEAVVCVSVFIGLASLWVKNLFLNQELVDVQIELNKSHEEALKWKKENAQFIEGLSSAIDQQLQTWALTPSEKDVALLLLKGLSLKEIADIRSVSERTVRQQSTVVYQKSGLAGRAELSAFFLEDLLK